MPPCLLLGMVIHRKLLHIFCAGKIRSLYIFDPHVDTI